MHHNNERFTEIDRQCMSLALRLAVQGEGLVEPNPMVGCVLTDKDGRIIGEGYHDRFGGLHAERHAIANAIERGFKEQIAGGTCFVTLEPCCHHGKTPPCTDALIASGISRVVVATTDVNPIVAGKGIQQLIDHGVRVDTGLMQSEVEKVLAPYAKRHHTNLPWIIAKWAMSLDGKIATHTGDSKWISSNASRALVQGLRSRVDAIVVGSRTAVMDDPMLNARVDGEPLRRALRVVVDSKLEISLESKLVGTACELETLIWTSNQASASKLKLLQAAGCTVVVSPESNRNDRLYALMRYLVLERQATNVLVEGGGKLLGSLLELKQIDQCEIFVGSKLIGGANALSPVMGRGIAKLLETPECELLQVQQIEDDCHLSYRLKWS